MPGSDDAQVMAPFHDAVQRAGLVPLLHGRQLLPQPPVCRSRIGGDHHPPANIPLEACRPGRLGVRAGPHHRIAVAHAGGHPEQHRRPPPLGNLDGGEHEIIRLLRVGRLEHGNPRRHRVTPVVLLVLAGRHARIVRRHDDQRARHARIGRRKQRIGRHIQPHVLHRAQCSRPAKGRADRHLQRHLLVRRPLRMAAVFGEGLQDFSGRRAGIPRAQGHPCMPGGQRDGLIPAQQ